MQLSKIFRAMAGILQNLFVRALNPESVRSLKMVMSHASLYFGIILYTAVGAKVLQLLYFFVLVILLLLNCYSFWCAADNDCAGESPVVMTLVLVYCSLRKCGEFDTLQC